MIIQTIINSIAAGSFLGFLYALLFVYAQKGVPSFVTHIFFTAVRFILLIIAGFYLFISPSIHPVILVISFLVAFWLVILKQKAPPHEGHRAFRR
jgi:hypothetical protein